MWRQAYGEIVRAMFSVRIHGRGGQGVVTAAELLSAAAFLDGAHAQAFPSFGSERTGAPVVAFCRIDAAPIRVRAPIVEPDALIVQDASLLHQVDVFDGLRPGGLVLLNSVRTPVQLGVDELDASAVSLGATDLAREHLGRPLPNAALLGAFAALTGCVTLRSLDAAIRERFPGDAGQGNAAAARAAYDLMGEAANA
jgi:pyruvate ferredoxin oxidoreductase gamma subunit